MGHEYLCAKLSYDAAGRLVQLVRGLGTLTTNYTYYGWTETASLDGQPVGQESRLKQVATGTLQDLRYLYMMGMVTVSKAW